MLKKRNNIFFFFVCFFFNIFQCSGRRRHGGIKKSYGRKTAHNFFLCNSLCYSHFRTCSIWYLADSR